MNQTPIIFDARWIGDHGIGRFAREVRRSWPGAADLDGDGNPADPLDSARLALHLRHHRSAFFYSPGYGAPLASRIPFAITIHDLNHIDFAPSRTAAKLLYYKLFLRPACRRASVLLTVSEYTRQRICEWSGVPAHKVVNVGNGVDPLFQSGGTRLAHPRPYLLCMGNRRAHKNEVRTLEAFAQVARRQGELDLIYSGRPSRELSARVENLGLTGRVHFLGDVSDAELAAAYRGAQVVLFASLYEGFGLPIVEAQACGTPVITSNVCALPEVAGNAALLVDPQSTEEIAGAIDKLLSDPALASNLSARGQENAARFSWDATRSKVHALINSAANA
jgi:glycosyltransferase involved in cell wall biosynthesis